MSKLDARHSDEANQRIDKSTNEAHHFRDAQGIATPATPVPHCVHLPSRSARTRV
jgi:hypothetical protein